MIKLLIADDHVMFRDGLRRVLEEDSHLEVIGEAKNSVEALAKSADLRPDVVILDLVMPPGRDAVDTVGELKRRNPEVKIVILTARSEDEYALRCLRAGADGYLTKINASAELIHAINKVYGGGKYIGEALAQLLAENIGQDPSQLPHSSLSDREFQVMRMIGQGKAVSEIGSELNLSVKTVSTYRSRILEKTQLRNNAEIMRYAIEHSLVD